MMQKTKITIPPNPILDYHHPSLFLGSCFAENMAHKMNQSGFKVVHNPFGVIFNPVSLVHLISASQEQLQTSVFMRKDVALSWLANGTIFAYDEKEIYQRLLKKKKQLEDAIENAQTVFVTWGTSWVYQHKETEQIVANCHKMEQHLFQKRLLTVSEIVSAWQPILEKMIKSKVSKIVFTVSPVRHVKDGFIENARSKAVLLTAIHQLNEMFDAVSYFPSYEIVLDELRDYAYFQADGVHPNNQAIACIWNYFKSTYFTKETAKIEKEFEQIRQLFSHRLHYPKSEEAQHFIRKRDKKWEDFKVKYNEITWRDFPG